MTVNSMDPIGVEMTTSPPPRFSTPRPASRAEGVGEGEHVVGGSSEPSQGCDDKGVALVQRVQGPNELRPR